MELGIELFNPGRIIAVQKTLLNQIAYAYFSLKYTNNIIEIKFYIFRMKTMNIFSLLACVFAFIQQNESLKNKVIQVTIYFYMGKCF
jgi:hypothetical protein